VYVNRLRFRSVKSLNRDIPEGGGEFPGPARRRSVLQGGNGSGKSTVLETIATLWRLWGEWIEQGQGFAIRREELTPFLQDDYFAAMEMVGIPDTPPLWIGVGAPGEWSALKETYPEALFAGLVLQQKWGVVELPPRDFLGRRHRSLAGSEPFPNVVFFPPEGRTIEAPERPRAEIIDTTRFNWTAVYDPTVNLDSVLLTVQALSPERFEECLRLVNLALEHCGKRIAGFGPKGRLIVEGTKRPFRHPIEELSSGERQMLLLVGFIVAFLRPGGIVLLDEPDLHMHIGMVEQLLETVERVIQERKGQWIVASHSVLVWEWFARPEEQIDLNPWREGKA
jgi:AAA domain, putative AbiEii toxin, Type IV TA system